MLQAGHRACAYGCAQGLVVVKAMLQAGHRACAYGCAQGLVVVKAMLQAGHRACAYGYALQWLATCSKRADRRAVESSRKGEAGELARRQEAPSRPEPRRRAGLFPERSPAWGSASRPLRNRHHTYHRGGLSTVMPT
ncbi:hypothetical protein NDU88_005060 [Pleurodeles waltl]|uniref:Uncharacterized protein n=1 Tax=Pleurodeles waltl TaxID=8319 RepID=A0AAV7VIV3_PLEWA|nr:hypothetical protein NDU88_005060 [Pleurodeles waltl]